MQVATMGGSSQYVIAALVFVCLLRKAEAQSECRCIRVMCLATTTAEAATYIKVAFAKLIVQCVQTNVTTKARGAWSVFMQMQT